MSSALEVLRTTFGFDAFRPGQERVIASLLDGRSASAVFPTGAGKSMCYQLPAVMLSGLTLVVSPLIALMKDQIDKLEKLGVAAARLDSSLTADELATVMQSIRDGQTRLLYVAPERFNNERFREAILPIKIGLFAVDEAHCISEWGHSFRPDYLKLARFAERCKAERVLALTATATPRVLDDICRGFGIDPENAVRTGFYRPNLRVLFTPVDGSERDRALAGRLAERPAGPAIVYVTLQKTAEQVAAMLARNGVAAKAYHAGMKPEDRVAVQEWFSAAENAVVVATIAFGMGIDKANIRYIYHYNPPKSLENYSQEIGRAGRDGQPALCETLFHVADLTALENFAYGDTPTRESVGSFMEEVLRQGDEFDVSIYDLAYEHDIRPLVASTLLTLLEMDGHLEAMTPFYSSYQFQPRMSSAEILARFTGERQEFVANVFRQARKAKTWFHIDLAAAAQKLNQPRDRIVRALDYLAEQQWLDVKVSGLRHRYRRLQVPSDLEALADDHYGQMVDREEREIRRLDQVVELAGLDGCQTAKLCAHFGETLAEPCGHCTWCLNDRRATAIPGRPERPFGPDILERASAIRRQHPDPLAHARSLARFLCGLSSPRLVRHKLTRDPLFGVAADIPFAKVAKEVG